MFIKRPRKRFGQHFLQNDAVISAIIQAISLKSDDVVIEIGPGRGALTYPLLKILHHLIVIEVDQDIVSSWHNLNNPKLNIINSDVLKVKFNQWGQQTRLIGNLPYNISTPLLMHLFNYLNYIKDMHFMLQKEVVDRICASPGTKSYGRLTVMIQAFCDVSNIMDVEPNAFYPEPMVHSAVIRLTPLKKVHIHNKDLLKQLVAKAFAMRRKTLANNFKGLISMEYLEKYGLNPKMRPEEVSVQQYITLANNLNS